MNECKVCKKQFEDWDADFKCNQCDEYGQIERWYDWSFGEPDLVDCPDCHGEKIYKESESAFCSEECRHEYFYPDSECGMI